ncbi:MAG: polysaccharide deacetylase family protein [Planctomycetaceae bacterium]|jgi:peptidoglycan/xylan/chitin deacetylase (PgdA/CDA1 family)
MTRPTLASRRQFLGRALSTVATGGALATAVLRPGVGRTQAAPLERALISITLDLEMSRNFPQWEMTHWDYEKGNLDADTKAYAVEAGQRVRERGGVIHYFCVGRVLEQENVTWLKELAESGHKIGNHTYDHVNMLAQKPADVQFRFQRAPWLMRGQSVAAVLQDNVRMTNEALQARLGIQASGFRTPGGFATGLDGREDLQKMLLGEGFSWISSKYPSHATTIAGERPSAAVFADIVQKQAAAQPYRYPTGLWEIPMSPISDIGAFRGGRWPLEDFLEAVRRGVTWAIENRGVFDFLAHPSCLLVADPRFQVMELICDLVQRSEGRGVVVDLDRVFQSLVPT